MEQVPFRQPEEEVTEALAAFEYNLRLLQPTILHIETIEALFEDARQELPASKDEDYWYQFIRHATRCSETEVLKQTGSARVVIRSLENYIAHNRTRPYLRYC